MLIAEIRKTPDLVIQSILFREKIIINTHISQSDSVPEAGEEEVALVVPVPSVQLLLLLHLFLASPLAHDVILR